MMRPTNIAWTEKAYLLAANMAGSCLILGVCLAVSGLSGS